MIGRTFKNIDSYRTKQAHDWEIGLQSLNKLSFDMDSLIQKWEINAERIFKDIDTQFVYDYVNYVKKTAKLDFMDFNEWCYENGINIMDKINTQRAQRKISERR